MLLKIVHYILLFCYLNIIAYHPQADVSNGHNHPILNGESLLEFVLEDFLSIPIDDHSQDVELLYDQYLGHKSTLGLSIFLTVLAIIFYFQLFVGYNKHPRYGSKKWNIILDYHTHLHRLHIF